VKLKDIYACPVCGERGKLAEDPIVPIDPPHLWEFHYRCPNGHRWSFRRLYSEATLAKLLELDP